MRIRNSNAAGWFTMPYTLAQEQGRDRWTRFNDCVNAASAGGYTVPAGHRTVVVTNVGIYWWGAGGAIYLDGTGLGSVSVAHEMLHGYGLGHSFSNDTGYRNAPWSAPGEYDDPWDEMSAANVYASGTGGTYGNTQPVGLVGFQLDKLGWVDHGRVSRPGRATTSASPPPSAPRRRPTTRRRPRAFCIPDPLVLIADS
ncbi:hypothetical protein J5Y04_26320 [Kitasatospora sp. RG8]|uniref:hypothetical protein n=1 Tax=Kitasatospora sp. RG8 TaxID=2820815 RepID=UPI001AE09C92|nr:hypothetical protein [Kitasatospora sp. RG8]MBP0453033.1 hypothetical protein [Kitasatospora sp. RG8]